MKLTVSNRAGTKKSSVKEIRRQGDIPAVLYSKTKACEPITISGTEFKTILRELKAGRLPTTVFTLHFGKQERRAIIKDIQYQLTTYQVIHLDFEELHEEVPVSVKVPITVTGAADCVGIKLGGFLRQVIRYVKVECLPKKIPSEFQIDVQDLGIRQSKRLSDIVMPSGIRPLASLNEVIVVIAKR